MRKIILLSAIAGSLCLLPDGSSAQSFSVKKETASLKNLEYAWLIAEFNMDTATISPMMDASFISINKSGIETKQQELAGMYHNIQQRIKQGHTVDSLYLDQFRANFYGNTAIVTFVSVTSGKIKEAPFNNRRTLMYDVWIKRNNHWKAVSSQVVPLD